MEFLDDESRPSRISFHSRSSPSVLTPPHKISLLSPSVIFSFSLSLLFFSLAFFTIPFEPFKIFLLWIAISCLLGPFAPQEITFGDVSVGAGKILSNETNIERSEKTYRKSKNRKFDENPTQESAPLNGKESANGENGEIPVKKEEKSGKGNVNVVKNEREWSEGDIENLKKMIVKYPVGMPKRWEKIAELLDHSVESVVKKAKSLGEKKTDDSDSFAKFLKDRKPVDQRVEEEIGVKDSWSTGEDVALLNALKAFPKEANMRWEKIAAAVPGKTKAACVKRVAELKKDFRTSKGSDGS